MQELIGNREARTVRPAVECTVLIPDYGQPSINILVVTGDFTHTWNIIIITRMFLCSGINQYATNNKTNLWFDGRDLYIHVSLSAQSLATSLTLHMDINGKDIHVMAARPAWLGWTPAPYLMGLRATLPTSATYISNLESNWPDPACCTAGHPKKPTQTRREHANRVLLYCVPPPSNIIFW